MATSKQRGLTSFEAGERRRRFGSNVLTPPRRDPWWRQFLVRFDDPVIRILVVAALLSTLTGHLTESAGIAVAILLSTLISFFSEYRANREFDLLNRSRDDVPVRVVRDGNVTTVPRRDVVPGDAVLLEAGEEVPADGSVDEAVSLAVDESRLTGESAPTPKSPSAGAAPREPLASAYPPDAVLRGTMVVDGRGTMTVEATGDSTEYGRSARAASEDPGEATPLQRQAARLSRGIGAAGFIVAGLTFSALVVRGVVAGGLSWAPFPVHALLDYAMIAVTIIVASVPEGLPMSIVLSLAYSMRKMTAANNLVRRMHACETVGAATVICTDKTGTLTRNEMRVQEWGFPGGADSGLPADPYRRRLLVEAVAANTTADLDRSGAEAASPVGNPTEGALLLWLEENGVDYLPVRERFRVARQWPFSTERKFMGTLGVSAVTGTAVLYAKGAPEIVLSRCSRVMTPRGPEPIGDATAAIEEALAGFQAAGMRSLGLAFRDAPEDAAGMGLSRAATDLVWLGFAAIADPVREEVPEAMKECRNAGVRVIVVTGDNPGTARQVARAIGLAGKGGGAHRTGPEFAAMGEEDAKASSRVLEVLSRARPSDKLRLVRLLKEDGHVVAVTGDGTNDAPALTHADVGLAMGKSGTAVAREASDIVLLDDSFRSIVLGIRWGRSVYLNIQRFLLFQLTVSAAALGTAALGTALAGPFLGIPMPFTVTQILWVNLIMDTFAALALATLPPDDGLMDRPPRDPAEFIVTRPMARNLAATALPFLALFIGGMLWILRDGRATDLELSVFFTTFVMLQFWNLFNARAFGLSRSALAGLSRNRGFLRIVFLILVGQILVVQYGGSLFRTVPLPLPYWISIVAGTSTVLWVGEAWRWRLRRRTGSLQT
ncbi:MAG: calcium-translocating P-type ATPase, PMCA-type [Deltaproteobacteria bacterium]|nr:calcium-translocating P-type ATPase, PMCA-type [Deltaproteobacteria bacterium]